MKIKIRSAALISISIFFASLFSGCYLLPSEEETLAPPLVEPVKASYDVLETTMGNIERKISGDARFVPTTQYNLSFRERGGILKTLFVKEGDSVKEGDVLAQFDTEKLLADILNQEAALRKVHLEKQQFQIASQADIKLAELQLSDMESKLQQILAEDGSGEKGMSLADTYSKAEITDMQTGIAKQKIILSKSKEIYSTGLASRDEDIFATTRELDRLRRELERAKLVSPIAGIVVFVDPVKVGDYVDANKTIACVADTSKLVLEYSGSGYSDLRLGIKLKVTVEEGEYSGTVVTTPESVPEDAAETLKNCVHIKVAGLPPHTKPGDYADIETILERKENVIVIPSSLIRIYDQKTFVQVLEDGIKKDREVKTGIDNKTEMEITSGLKVGEKLIVR